MNVIKRVALYIAIVFSVACIPIYGAFDYSIVFVHIGDVLPQYLKTSLTQTRAFNKDCPIILVANEIAFKNVDFSDLDITQITCESLIITSEHQKFRNRSKLNDRWRKGFWRYTSERFLYLHDLMTQFEMENVFHLENDVMLYVDLAVLLPVFKTKYKGIAATFDHDRRCIPGFLYIKDPKIMLKLAKYFEEQTHLNDIDTLVQFRKEYGKDSIDNLPVIMEEYTKEHSLGSFKYPAKDKRKYCQNIEFFGSIFDAAAIGQYLGGKDPENGSSGPGFINEACAFNPSLLSYEWLLDDEGRKVPFAQYAKKKFRINNLHIHSKKLSNFTSYLLEEKI